MTVLREGESVFFRSVVPDRLAMLQPIGAAHTGFSMLFMSKRHEIGRGGVPWIRKDLGRRLQG